MDGQDDLARRLIEDMDPKLLEFIRTRVNSFIKWDLARFFHENPHTADTAENIARYTGRDVHAIETDLVELVDAAVLQTSTASGLIVYRLSAEEDVRALIAQFIRACDDRQFRVKAIYHVIRAMR